jgi:hypothetical protein
MPQKEGCENQISDDTEVREEWRFGYRGVSDLIRGRKRGPRSLRNSFGFIQGLLGQRVKPVKLLVWIPI